MTIDEQTRSCSCGHFKLGSHELRACAGHCMGTFTLSDYPPGYFAFKYQVRPGTHVSVCPPCEADILECVVEELRSQDPLTIQASSQQNGLRRLEDIELLRTGRIVTDRHRKQALHTHGSY